MIPIPSLDTQSFKEIYENMRLTAGLSGNTEMTYQDPGETLLEMFALIFDMQRFYMDQITDEHRIKYARLLSLSPEKMRYATTLMALNEGNFNETDELEPYALLIEGEIPFELVQKKKNKNVIISKNKISSFEPVGNNGCQWIIKFEKDLGKYPIWHIYIELKNPLESVSRDSLTYPIAMWQCEYLSKNGLWKPAFTKDFDGRVKDGFLPLATIKENSNNIRITLTGDDIEIMPKLLSVRINVVKARQAQTIKNYKFTTNGTPNQSIPLEIKNLDENSVKLQISGTEWELVDNFHASKPTDHHFIVEDNIIHFGDHERGEIPLGEGAVTYCISSLGLLGNIPKGAIKSQLVENITAAVGGRDAQSDPLADLSKELKRLHKAVTAEDYETILHKMPVLKLEQIRATMAGDAAIKIYVKPASEKHPFPKLNETYRKNILAYLEPYRIITTKLEIESVEYRPFTIKLTLDFAAQYNDGEKQIIAALKAHFPFQNFYGNYPRRPFGEKITYGDIYRIVSSVPQVKTIETLDFSNIQLKAGELAYIEKIIINNDKEAKHNG
jgi:hypothetical protein